jgi:hypothetical protein
VLTQQRTDAVDIEFVVVVRRLCDGRMSPEKQHKVHRHQQQKPVDGSDCA